jgi:phosphoribosyl 1,2-cyclic phosphodiesterase
MVNNMGNLIATPKKIILDSAQLERAKKLKTPTKLDLSFWGTRGSIPVSGAAHLRYGGNTSCVSLTSDTGHLYVFDCGSGARQLGEKLLAENKTNGIDGYIFISHTHWDHIQGFPFFAPFFRPENRFNILGYASQSSQLIDILAGQMKSNYFPVSLYSLPADLGFYALQEHNKMLELDGAKIKTVSLKHPLPSLAYRIDLGGKSVVYATDHEPLHLPDMEQGKPLGFDVIDERLVKLAQGADVLIHDAQYSNDELCCKVGWGHNTAEIAVDTAVRAGVKTLVLYHHDPSHNDEAIDTLLANAHRRAADLGNPALEIVSARDGMNIRL